MSRLTTVAEGPVRVRNVCVCARIQTRARHSLCIFNRPELTPLKTGAISSPALSAVYPTRCNFKALMERPALGQTTSATGSNRRRAKFWNYAGVGLWGLPPRDTPGNSTLAHRSQERHTAILLKQHSQKEGRSTGIITLTYILLVLRKRLPFRWLIIATRSLSSSSLATPQWASLACYCVLPTTLSQRVL